MEGAYRGMPRGRGGKFEWNGIWLSAGNAKQRGHTGERKRRALDGWAVVTLTVGASERKMPKESAFKPSRELAKG